MIKGNVLSRLYLYYRCLGKDKKMPVLKINEGVNLSDG